MSGWGSGRRLLGLRSAVKQVLRFKSQRWSLGKPPGEARSLQQRLAEWEAAKQTAATVPLNIGFAPVKQQRSKEKTLQRLTQLKEMRSGSQQLPPGHVELVDLEKVREEWDGSTVSAVMASAQHYNVYNHLFGDGAYFVPALRLNVLYSNGYPVHWGNLLTPTQAVEKPQVSFESSKESLWTLVLSTPDGHLTQPDSEYVLWLVGNIKGGDMNSGEEVVPYLQPFPLKGIGTCRYVFVLYKQTKPIDFSSLHKPSWKELETRDFSSQGFYGRLQEDMTPASLAFFQAEWDDSVRQLFYRDFSMEQPTCSYDFPPPYHPKQKWFPLRQPFNLYMDRYRDEKQIAKEYLVRKLKHYDPWTGFPRPLEYPNAIAFKPDTPSWLKNEMKKSRLGRARYQDY